MTTGGPSRLFETAFHHDTLFDPIQLLYCITAYLAYIISQFGIERCKIQFFIEHFSGLLESSQDKPLHNNVNI